MRALVDIDPLDYWGYVMAPGPEYSCRWCYQGADRREDVKHESDCAWVVARKMLGMKNK